MADTHIPIHCHGHDAQSTERGSWGRREGGRPGADEAIDDGQFEVSVVEHERVGPVVGQAGVSQDEGDEGDDAQDIEQGGRLEILETAGLQLPEGGHVQTLVRHP